MGNGLVKPIPSPFYLEEKSLSLPLEPYCNEAKYSLWINPIGNYSHQKKQGNFPESNFWIGGVVTAFDYIGIENAVLGFGAAYVYNYAHFTRGGGHSKTNQEFLTLYGSWSRKNFYIDCALWGGLYQTKNIRHSAGNISSQADINGWLFNPHLQLSTPFYIRQCWLLMEPFAMFDWANNWQGKIREKGPSGFNLRIKDQYTSLLRSELGVKFYQFLQYGWGIFAVEEKGSWINKCPFHSGRVQAIFLGRVSPFPIEIFNNETQNLGAVQMSAWFLPCNKKYPYGSLSYQAEFNSSFQNHSLNFEIGKDF